MEVFDNPDYAEVVNSADMIVADGKPIFIAQSSLGYKDVEQVRGEYLTLALFGKAEAEEFSVGLFGAVGCILLIHFALAHQ